MKLKIIPGFSNWVLKSIHGIFNFTHYEISSLLWGPSLFKALCY